MHAREEGVADLLEDVRLGLGVRHLAGGDNQVTWVGVFEDVGLNGK